MTALPPPDPTRLPLSREVLKDWEKVRPLSSYKLNYVDPNFPILAFTYAVISGGEYTLYCDHPRAYIKEYWGYDIETGEQDPAFRLPAERRTPVLEVLARLDRDRDQGPFPTREEWKVVMEQLGEELITAGALMPSPLW
jgi:hypothetical protein